MFPNILGMMDKQYSNFEKLSYAKYKYTGIAQDSKCSYLVIEIDGEGAFNEYLETVGRRISYIEVIGRIESI